MKGIYKIIKKEIQDSIKRIAEKRCIGVLNVLTTTDGDIFSEFMSDLEALTEKIHSEFDDVPKETVQECYEDFLSEIAEFICPDWNCTIGESYHAHLNRRLIEEGYETVSSDALVFLIEEMGQLDEASKVLDAG